MIEEIGSLMGNKKVSLKFLILLLTLGVKLVCPSGGNKAELFKGSRCRDYLKCTLISEQNDIFVKKFERPLNTKLSFNVPNVDLH